LWPSQIRLASLVSAYFFAYNERRIPAPPSMPVSPHAALKRYSSPRNHAAAGIDVILPAIFGPGAGIDHDDLQWRNACDRWLQLVLRRPWRLPHSHRQMTKVQLHTPLQAPFQRHFVRWSMTARRGSWWDDSGREHRDGCRYGWRAALSPSPSLTVRQIFSLRPSKKPSIRGKALLVIAVLNDGMDCPADGRHVILQWHGNVDQLRAMALLVVSIYQFRGIVNATAFWCPSSSAREVTNNTEVTQPL